MSALLPGVLPALLAGCAAALAVAPHPRLPVGSPPPRPAVAADRAVLGRFRVPLAVLAGLAGPLFVDGLLGFAAGVAAAGGVLWVAARAEPPGVRSRRERLHASLPQVALLLGVALESGQSPAAALGVVADAVGGPAGAVLARARAALDVGTDPVEVWESLGADGLEALGRALARAERSGAPVAVAIARLADELSADQRARVEDRARTVGIKAAVPLGLCLLPAFLLVGIVPVVAAAVAELRW